MPHVSHQAFVDPASRRPALTPLSVLLADDNAVNRRVVEAMLRKQGHQVVAVADGAAAVQHHTQQRFDLVLLDIQMPGMTGIEAAKCMRRRDERTGARTPIVALSAQDPQDVKAYCADAGVDAFLDKPVSQAELVRVAAQVMEKTEAEERPRVALFDRAALLHRVEGDDVLLAEIVRVFLEDEPGTMQEIRGAFEANDMGRVAFAAHKLKGALATISAARASQAARALEEQAKAQNEDAARAALGGLEEKLNELLPVLTRELTPA